MRTILEIGGQDSKIICVSDGIAVDYAMNTQIRTRDDGAVLVDDHALRGNGADVDAEIALCHLLFSFFMESMS